MRKEITYEDVIQTEMIDKEQIERFLRDRSIDGILGCLKNEVEEYAEDRKLYGEMVGSIKTLIMLEKNEQEILELGRQYFIEKISASIPMLQILVKNLETISIEEDELYEVTLIKQVCYSLIKEFGV